MKSEVLASVPLTRITPFELFKTYVSLKIHFSRPDYDFFKFNRKAKSTTVAAFEKRKDKYFFHKLAAKYDETTLINIFVANFIDNPEMWIGDAVNNKAVAIHKAWQKRTDSLTYYFEQDLQTLIDFCSTLDCKFADLLTVHNGQHPLLLTMTMHQRINFETFAILLSLLKLSPKWDKKIRDELVWPSVRTKAEKYLPFLNFDQKKLKKILKDKVNASY